MSTYKELPNSIFERPGGRFNKIRGGVNPPKNRRDLQTKQFKGVKPPTPPLDKSSTADGSSQRASNSSAVLTV